MHNHPCSNSTACHMCWQGVAAVQAVLSAAWLAWQCGTPAMATQSVARSPLNRAGNWQGRPVTEVRLTLVAA